MQQSSQFHCFHFPGAYCNSMTRYYPYSLVSSDFAAAAVLITMGAVLGRASPFQLVIIAFFELMFYSANEALNTHVLKVSLLNVFLAVLEVSSSVFTCRPQILVALWLFTLLVPILVWPAPSCYTGRRRLIMIVIPLFITLISLP